MEISDKYINTLVLCFDRVWRLINSFEENGEYYLTLEKLNFKGGAKNKIKQKVISIHVMMFNFIMLIDSLPEEEYRRLDIKWKNWKKRVLDHEK